MPGLAPSHALALGAALCIACTDGPLTPGTGSHAFTNVPAPAGGVAQFTFLPVAIAAGQSVTALGNLNPPGHVLPTDHIYFYDGDLSGNQPFGTDVRDVLMPATGAVTFIIRPSGTDYKIMFRATENFYFYLDHILLSQSLTVGQVLQAGTKIGITAQGSAIDLGAFDFTVKHTGFIDTLRYGAPTLHYVAPRSYFAATLMAQIDAHLYRAASASDKGGQIDFGIPGKLVGDWFLLGMPKDSSGGPYGWTRSIAFVYDYYDPTKVRISIGGTVAGPGVWGIDATAPLPETVTVASGIVSYKLYSPFDPSFPPTGLLLVQMTDASTIKVEYFPGSSASATQFDANAVTFVR
jgi:hypothetical protein